MASKRGRRRAACEGKVQFESGDAAWSARRRSQNWTVQAYRCPFGAHWHLGHRPHRMREAARLSSRLA